MPPPAQRVRVPRAARRVLFRLRPPLLPPLHRRLLRSQQKRSGEYSGGGAEKLWTHEKMFDGIEWRREHGGLEVLLDDLGVHQPPLHRRLRVDLIEPILEQVSFLLERTLHQMLNEKAAQDGGARWGACDSSSPGC